MNWYTIRDKNQSLGLVTLIYDRWTHRKRGERYDRLNQALVQCSTRPIEESDEVTVYMNPNTGQWYVRLRKEFEDGRFI